MHSPLPTLSANPVLVPANPLRILVVEDHADIRTVIGMFLEGLGHRVAFAVDAGSALVRAREQTFDVLLTDIGLPGRDGWELLRELASHGRLPLRVISMSAANTGGESARSRAAGCHAHLLKPFKPGELREVLLQGGPPAG